jgi:signal transduction histidine kinase/CheY-like chemotaxis protein
LLLGAAILIALLLAVIVIGGALWVFRMRRMQWHLRDAHEHAEAANAAKSRFLAVMSHELRTPLNGVLGMAQALKKNDLSETQREQVDILVDSGKTLLVLLNDVLDMSRIEAGKIELAPTPSTMKDMIERVINTYGSLLDGKDVMLRYELGENASEPMTFDVLRVYQCLSNLVSNALKFTEKGTVRILTSAMPREEGGYRVRVEVRDTGIGMSKATLDKLFEAFTQADAMTARKYGGTGLGLNISRRLAELMGGALSVTSEEGAGSAFVMTFDAGEVMATEETEQSEVKTMPKHDDNADLPGMHILLVDDHPVNRKVARLFLEPFGFIITEAVDGQEALDLDMSRYDLVLMDLNMPRLGGLEATRIFRAQEPEGQHVPIVALTADAMHDQVEACHAAGMDAHIPKPIIMDTLIDTVAGLLRLKEDQPDAKAEVA